MGPGNTRDSDYLLNRKCAEEDRRGSRGAAPERSHGKLSRRERVTLREGGGSSRDRTSDT